MSSFVDDLRKLINRHCYENESNTPDYILAMFVQGCLDSFNTAVKKRDEHYHYEPNFILVDTAVTVGNSRVNETLAGIKFINQNNAPPGKVLHGALVACLIARANQ